MTLAARLPLLLLVGLGAALLARVNAGPPDSPAAGLLFAACLTALCAASRAPLPRPPPRDLGWAGLGAAVLCLPALPRLHATDTTGYASWAVAVSVVVLAEEAFLRGALFGAVQRAAGSHLAVVVSAVAFAAIHVPLYGWHVVPLDLAVGVLLGALRLASGSWLAPAGAHAVADWVGWFCR